MSADERAVLACILNGANPRGMVESAHFATDAHRALFDTMAALAKRGTRPDPVSVFGELTRNGQLARVGGAEYLHHLFSLPVHLSSLPMYAGHVRSAARIRVLREHAIRIQQVLEEVTDQDAALDTVARELVLADAVVGERAWDEPLLGLSTWQDFAVSERAGRSWLVPGLLAWQDVVMILSPPGAGKSTLSRQVALTVAAGVHPFLEERIEPRRTLLCDFENPEEVVASEGVPLLRRVDERYGVGDRAWLWHWPRGVNLRTPGGARMFERAVVESGANLVVFGSLYKAFQRGRDDWDTAANEVREVLDDLRTRHRVALWIEHHMPRERQNPYGSSVWEWWPTVGRVLRRMDSPQPVYELTRTFREDRGVHEGIPVGLVRTKGLLPWSAVWDTDELEAAARA